LAQALGSQVYCSIGGVQSHMTARLLLALTLFGCAAATQSSGGSANANAGQQRQLALEQAWASELDDAADPKIVAHKSPVKRVVNLLGKMKAQLETEGSKESEMYDKMVCWCETNNKEKTKSIADADAKDLELTSEVEGRSARFGKLTTEIANLKEQIAANTEALKEATAIRETEADRFRGAEKDLVQYVANLQNAISVLAKHNGGSLLQEDKSLFSSVQVLLHEASLKYEMLLAGREGDSPVVHPLKAALLQANKADDGMSRALLKALDANSHQVALPLKFAERVVAQSAQSAQNPSAASGTFLQAGGSQPNSASYSSRSGQIYGLMDQMLEEFRNELTAEQKAELQAQTDFKALSAAKAAQIAAGKKRLDDQEGENADNQKALSDAKEDLALTREQRSKDVEFLRNLKLTCNDLDKEWQRRSATRSEEIKAVSEAVVILTEDDNREMLAKTVTLLQTRSIRSAAEAMARRSMEEGLLRAAQDPNFDDDDLLSAWHDRKSGAGIGAAAGPRAQLSTLAMSVKLDTFTKVKELMDKMLAALKTEQLDEVKFKAYCIKELDVVEKETYAKNEEKQDLEAKLQQLANLIAQLADEIAQARSDIANAQTEIKKASQNREAENAAFQATVADQRATQTILNKALTRLQAFYEKNIGVKVIYAQQEQTPPVKFNKYKANAGSNPVIGLLQQIIGDSVTLEGEATSGEASAQADYEVFVKDSNALISGLSDAVASKGKATADAKLDSAEAQGDLDSTIGELESLTAYDGDLHGQCDWVLKNFDVRQKARLQEMEAIQSAKSILSGAAAAM